MNITPGIRLGDFEIAAPLGKGGMGEVFKARDTHLGREVAIKLLPQNVSEDPEMLARFDREAKVLAALSHPGIAVLFGFEKHELPSSPPVHYLVMELVSGETLADRLARGKMSLGDTLEIFTQIADALDAAHEKGIVHRDLKPANIMLSNDTTVKILDFGLARSFTLEDSSVPEDSDEDPEATAIPASPFPNLTGTHQILGTPAYMSPEQARGLRVDRRTDIWAFGCCLFEALTGTLAFQGATTADILKSVLAEHPPLELLPPHTPPALVDLVERCVRKDARERLRDVGEAWVALRELSGHSDPYTVTLPVEHNETGRLQRLSINLYPDPQIDTFDLHFELAPDSSVLAYTGMQEERRILTLRALDSISPVTVPATKGVNLPFFSPDSNWIGFFGRDPDRLMRVSMSGGDPLEICRVDSMLGGCWFSDGSIVIGGGPGTGLQRIDPESGESVRILTDPEYDHWSHVRPVCTPGERFVLFECRTKSHKKFPDIHILDLSDGSARPLVRHARQPVCPRDDLLVCQQLSGLVGFPLDQESRRVTGNPIAICEPHMPREVMEPIVFSLNRSGDLAYLPEYEDDRRKFRLVWVTQDGKETAANLAPNHYVDPCLSPDGTEAVVAVRTRFGIELRVADLVRGAIHPVEQCDAINFSPYWLNHSEDILYASSNGSTWQLRRQKIGARNFDVEWEGTDLVWVVNGTSDDKTFLVGRQHADTGRSVFGLWRPEDEAEIAISFHQGLESTEKPTLSPDGAWIAYTSSVSGSREVFVLPAEGDAARPKQLSINGGDDPLWDSKGDRIFYRNGNAVLEVAVEHSGRFVAHEPSPLFAGDYAPVGHRSWQRSNHDDRFLMLKSMEGTSEMPRPTEVAFVRNWLTSVDRRDKDNIGRTNT